MAKVCQGQRDSDLLRRKGRGGAGGTSIHMNYHQHERLAPCLERPSESQFHSLPFLAT